MTDLRKAAEMALKYFEDAHGLEDTEVAIREALRQALAQPEQEQKTPLKVLNLTVFTENRLRNGRVYDVETLQAMTSRDILAIPDMGKKALKEVMEALDVYAVNMSQERVDETAKDRHISYVCPNCYWSLDKQVRTHTPEDVKKIERKWVGLTDHELQVLDFNDPDRGKLARAVEAKLKEKNT